MKIKRKAEEAWKQQSRNLNHGVSSLHFFSRRAVEQRACYYPNGNIALPDAACDPSASVSPCCGGGVGCLDSKMCQSSDESLIRGSCTDPTWKSPDCPDYCLGDNGGPDLISCQNVTNSNLDFCCDHTIGCCDTGVGRFRLPRAGEPLTSSGLPVSSATSHSSTTNRQSTTDKIQPTGPVSTPLPLPSQTPSSASASTFSTGTKAEIGTGVSLGAIIIIILSVLLWQSRRRNRNSKKKAIKQDAMFKSELDANEPQRPDCRVRELPRDMAHELAAGRDGNWIWELPAE